MASTNAIAQLIRRPPWQLADPRLLLKLPTHPVDWYHNVLCYVLSYMRANPVDNAAVSATRDVYLDLCQAVCRTVTKLIIGQELRGFDGGNPEGKTPENAFDQPIAGLSPQPALVEVDLKDFWSYFYLDGEDEAGGQPRDARMPSGGAEGWRYDHDERLFAVLVQHVNRQIADKRSPILGFCYHVGNPFNVQAGAKNRQVRAADGTTRDMTANDLFQLTGPTTLAGQQWKKGLDRVTEIITQVRDRVKATNPGTEITVLFRPLHESNQLDQSTNTGFWWSYWGQSAFTAVWQDAFTYLTTTKGLHNLLWVFSATTKIQQGPLDDFTSHYPGDNLVDVVGMDLYDDALRDLDGWYEALLKKGKPVALTEYGPNQSGSGVNQSNKAVINTIHNQYPNLVYATCWYSDTPGAGNRFQINDKVDANALLTDPWSITLP